MGKLHIPILVDWDGIKDYMAKTDIVAVVRCKECRYYDADEKWCRRLGLCGAFDADGFCCHGERSEDATD